MSRIRNHLSIWNTTLAFQSSLVQGISLYPRVAALALAAALGIGALCASPALPTHALISAGTHFLADTGMQPFTGGPWAP